MSRRALRLAVSEPGRPAAPRPTIAVVRDAFRGPVVTRRKLQIALAFFWLLDGALQLQPVMFTRRFASGIIAPTGAGQPAPIHWAVSTGASVIGHSPVAFDAVFAVVQLLLGFGLLWGRTVRVALGASILWGLGVWVVGEGLGGVFGSGATLLSGAPGAALLYAVLGLGVWPMHGDDMERPSRYLLPAWAALWVGFAALELLAGSGAGAASASA